MCHCGEKQDFGCSSVVHCNFFGALRNYIIVHLPCPSWLTATTIVSMLLLLVLYIGVILHVFTITGRNALISGRMEMVSRMNYVAPEYPGGNYTACVLYPNFYF